MADTNKNTRTAQDKPPTRKSPKKKRGCLNRILHVFVVILIIFMLILGGAVGAGWYMFNEHVTKPYGITFPEALGLLSGLYRYDEKKIVSNAYDGDGENPDYQKFIDNFATTIGLVDKNHNPIRLDLIGFLGGNGLNSLISQEATIKLLSNPEFLEKIVPEEYRDKIPTGFDAEEYFSVGDFFNPDGGLDITNIDPDDFKGPNGGEPGGKYNKYGTIGDLNGDGKVDDYDKELAKVGDLNGDNKFDWDDIEIAMNAGIMPLSYQIIYPPYYEGRLSFDGDSGGSGEVPGGDGESGDGFTGGGDVKGKIFGEDGVFPLPPEVEINDKQFASIINEILRRISESASKGEEQGGQLGSIADALSGFDVNELAQLKQVIFEGDSANKEEFSIKVTVRTDIGAVLKKFAKGLVPDGVLPEGIDAVDIVSKILPKELFITLTIYPYSEKTDTVLLNNFDEKQAATFDKMLDIFLKDSFAAIFNTVDTTVAEMLDSLNQYGAQGMTIVFTHAEK